MSWGHQCLVEWLGADLVSWVYLGSGGKEPLADYPPLCEASVPGTALDSKLPQDPVDSMKGLKSPLGSLFMLCPCYFMISILALSVLATGSDSRHKEVPIPHVPVWVESPL